MGRFRDYERYGEGRERRGFSRGRGSSRPYRSTGGFGGGFESEENYFGSGRQSYGQGYTGSGQWGEGTPSYSSTWEDDEYTGFDRTNEPDWESSRFRGGRRDYDENPGREQRNRFTGGGFSGRSGYSGQNYGRGRYGSDFPESERGFRTEPYEQEDRGWLDRASDEVSSWFGDEEAERRRRMDERRAQFRGRGPRGYTRSDERIREDINDRLTDYPYLDASEIDVEVNNGDVILSGSVGSRYDKRLAEDIAEDVSGVKNCENRIRIDTEFTQRSATNWTTTGETSVESGRAAGAGSSTTSATGRTASGTTGSSTQTHSKARGRGAGS